MGGGGQHIQFTHENQITSQTDLNNNVQYTVVMVRLEKRKEKKKNSYADTDVTTELISLQLTNP